MRARHRLVEGESCFVVMSWTDAPLPTTQEEVDLFKSETVALLARLDRRRPVPGPPVARTVAAQRADLEVALLRPDRRVARRADDVAAGEPRRFAQLGLPLHLDPRHGLRPARPARARAFTPRPTTSSPSSATSSSRRAVRRTNGTRARRNLQVLYPVDGGESPVEVELDHLTGYVWSRPARVGNGAYNQTQFDILGGVVDCIYEHTRSRDALSERSWRIVVQAVETAIQCWREPDRGIWEVRGEPRHFTYSKVMCWVAIERGARLAHAAR